MSALLALAIGLGCVLLGNALEGGHLSSLTQPTAAIIVFGGTLGATWLSASPEEIRRLLRLLPRVLAPRHVDRRRLASEIVATGAAVRRDGIVVAESQAGTLADPAFRRGLQMLADGVPVASVRELLDTEAAIEEEHDGAAARLLEAAGGYAPTIGILGAVLGLIHVMRNLSEPAGLGEGIAVAFVATLYGVGVANLLLIPLGTRIRKIVARDLEDRQMVLVGLEGIAAGAPSRQLVEMLAAFGPVAPGAGDTRADAVAA